MPTPNSKPPLKVQADITAQDGDGNLARPWRDLIAAMVRRMNDLEARVKTLEGP